MSHAPGDLFEDPPVGFGLPRRLAGGAHPADPALTVGEGSVIFAPCGNRKDHMCKTGGFGLKDVVAYDECCSSNQNIDIL